MVSKLNDAIVKAHSKKKEGPVESVEEYLARGGHITKCKTYGARKYSSIPQPKKKVVGVDAQALLDNAVGTEHEAEVIQFLESQGYEVN